MPSCPSCDTNIPASAIRPARAMAVCPGCDATVRLDAEGEGWRAVGFTAPAAPDGLTVAVDEPPEQRTGGYRDAISAPGRFRASRRWWKPAVLFLTLFVIVWDGFLVFWYSLAFRTGGPLVMKLFPLVHVTVGLGLTWYVLATWLNRTTIEVEGGRLTSRHGPIPWPFDRSKAVNLEAVELFEAERAPRRFNSGKSAGSQTWNVFARTRDGRRVPVVTQLGDERQAIFLARRLDAQLG